MTDKLREAAQQALDDDLLVGQAQHLISALMNRGFLPNTLPTAEYITLWDVVKRHLRCVNKEGACAALAQQDAQVVPQDEIVAAWKSGMTVQYFVTIGHDEEWTDYTNPTPPDTSGTRLAWRVKPGQRSNAAPTPPAQQDAQAVSLVPKVWNSRKPGTGMPSGVQADDTVEWVNSTGISAISPHAQLLAWDGDYPVVRWRLVKREAPQPDTLNAAPTPPAQRVMLTPEEMTKVIVHCYGYSADIEFHECLARAAIEAYDRKNQELA